jgi:hypothetical protein
MRIKPFLLFFLFFLIFSCQDEAPKISFVEINHSLAGTNVVEINIPKALGSSEISEKINAALETKVISCLSTNDNNNVNTKTLKESINSFNKEFENFKNNFPNSQQLWEAQIDGEVLYQSDDIISASITSYINTGGAHGNLNITLLNFNPKTGNPIPNDKLFDDLEIFKKIVKPYFLQSIQHKDIRGVETFTIPKNIGFKEDGIILLYNTYEIAPYSEGIIEFTVPFEKIKSCLVFDSF